MKYKHPGERTFREIEINKELSPYNSVTGKFKAEIYNGTAIDTNVNVDVKFVLTWNDKENFMDELSELIKKYQI